MATQNDAFSRIIFTGTTITIRSDETLAHVIWGNTRAYLYDPEKNKTFTGNTKQSHVKLVNVHG